MTQLAKTDKNETIDSIRDRLAEISGQHTPDFWKERFRDSDTPDEEKSSSGNS